MSHLILRYTSSKLSLFMKGLRHYSNPPWRYTLCSKLSLFMKGLRHNSYRFVPSCSSSKLSLFMKGLRLLNLDAFGHVLRFQTFPVYEGIKTIRPSILEMPVPRSKLSLFMNWVSEDKAKHGFALAQGKSYARAGSSMVRTK